MFARLYELQLQKAIWLSEIPLAVYQTIDSKIEAPRAVGYKRGRLQEAEGQGNLGGTRFGEEPVLMDET